MCQFCVQHGDGKAWYLEASTYAYDLDADLERRKFLVDFVRNFESDRAWALENLEQVEKLPARVQSLAKGMASRKLQESHYGQPVPIEECEAILDICTSVVRIPCPCRTAAGTPDEGYCLAITTKPIDAVLDEAFADYSDGPDTSKFERLTKEQTLALLRRCEEQGLMHSIWTFVTPFVGAICNCDLASGCMAMRLTVEHATPNMLKGHWIANADLDACTGCAECVERCPFFAVAIGPGTKRALVDVERCYGCGVCRSACEYEALTLVPRETAAVAAS
jgi:Pyruvate/2-oxoacid:ferredoxin oxidoreductase delta subunit